MAQGVLYDNGPVITHPGEGANGDDLSMLQSGLGMNTFGSTIAVSTGFRIADEFSVTAENGWQFVSFETFAYQTGSGTASTITELNYRIWDGPPNDEDSNVVYGDGATNTLLLSEFSGIYRASEADKTNATRPLMLNIVDIYDLYLPAGTYWLDVQIGGSTASGPFTPPVTVLGETTTGNALQFVGTTENWQPMVDSNTGAAQGMPFVLYGVDAELRIVQEDIPVPEVSRGDSNVPVMAFYAGTTITTAVELTSLSVATVQADGVTPVVDSPVATVKLFLDANFDGEIDTPGTPLATAAAAADGTATLNLDGINVSDSDPVGLILAYDLRGNLASTAFPVVAASLALLVPALWFARRGRKAASLLVLGIVVTAISSCGPTQPPVDIQFRALITGGASEKAGGYFAGAPIGVDVTGAVGGTFTVTY
ncbi:MAG: hypothetical protein KF813_04325 [Trueperaceae bacterium]|nr:hypothetical protein [Trueperaceae bacterium]